MTPIKKFLSPVIYPVNKEMNRRWFIRYKFEDYNTGNFKRGKYYGILNLIADPVERQRQAEQYCEMMKRGEPLPVYQGLKYIPTTDHPRTFANVIECCNRALSAMQHHVKPHTLIQYRGRINVFAAWLAANNLQGMAIGAITKEHAQQFLAHLKNHHRFANKTYNDYKTLFGGIWNEYVEEGKIKYNPWRKINWLPKNTQHFKNHPPELRKFNRETMPGYEPQLWLSLQIIFYTGIRPGEECRLKIENIHFEQQMITVPAEVSKTKVARSINLPDELFFQLIKAGWDKQPAHHFIFTKSFCPGEKPVAKNYFAKRWAKYRKAFNIPVEFKLYGGKRTAGEALSLKYNTYVTKEHFGHRDIKSTMQYVEDVEKNQLIFLRKNYPVY